VRTLLAATIGIGLRSVWLGLVLLVAAVATPDAALAQSADCSDAPYFGVFDGNVHPNPPSQITIDGSCTFRNFPFPENPLTSNISFYAPGGGSWLIIFDNVFHTGNMSCNSNDVHQHKIWFTNSSGSKIHDNCRDLFIPVEKINKQNPSPTATIGVPFTYSLTIPILYDPNSGIVVDFQGSPNDLHHIVVWDDLNATGADLTYLGHTAYWRDSGDPVPHAFSNENGLLTFDFSEVNIVPAETQIIVELTVVLEDTPANTPGTQFVNTAKWEFGRHIDGVFYEPLPGEWGVTAPMTIAAPRLIVTKTGPATLGSTLNLGQWGEFGIDVHNTGLSDAWDVRILDRFPNGPSGGMCAMAPELLSARVYAGDGVTPVPGKGPLVPGTDFSVDLIGAPTCELTLTMLSAAAVIGPDERLIVTYRTQLDPHTEDGITLTNVAGAVRWFNDEATNPDRVMYSRTLTNGTPGVDDHEDAHAVNVVLYGFFFEKTVANLTREAGPAAIAAPGDRLRYTLRLQSTDVPLDNLTFRDDLGAMNPTAVFLPGSLTLVPGTLPPGANAANTNPNGGTNNAGILDIRNLSLPAYSQLSIQFDITLAPAINNGTYVINQAELWSNVKLADSDDPTVNGQADPDVVGDEDPTRVLVDSVPWFDVEKVSADIDGDPELLLPGERLRYTITVRNVGTSDAVDATLRDPIPEHTTYVPGSTRLNGAAVPDGPGGTPPFAAGMPLSTPLDPTPGSIAAAPGAGNIATVVFDVRVDLGTEDGTVIENQAFVSALDAGIVDQPSDDPLTPAVDDPTRDVVGDVPFLFAVKLAELEVDGGQPGIVDPGDVLRYTITIHNNGRTPATSVVLRDPVPANTTYVADSLTLNGIPVGQPDGGVSPLIAGIGVSSTDLTPPLPDGFGGTVSGGESAIVEFLLRVDDGVAPGTLIVNQATVESAELENLPTDGDGDPPTGPEPTVVVVGDVPREPRFEVQKVSADLDGDPELLLAGERLRYTITVRNVGTADARDAMFRDPIPSNATYVPGSTSLNGAPIPDGPGGTPPFVSGLPLSSPVDPTPGFMPAIVLPGWNNVATIVFEVRVDPDAMDGTIISNQAFVSSADDGIEQPSDDPRTPAIDDPTRDLVGDLPFLFAEKFVALEVDATTPDIVDPGDVLRYTIRIHNNGRIAATDVVLKDAVPANTSYVADSLTLNGLPVGAPDGGISPLIAGIGVGSSDLTPPLPDASGGTISAGGVATIEFLLRVNDGVASGTLITNQAVVESAELPDLLTDGDGNPATGPEPTIVVVGDVQTLAITKQVTVVGGGPALAGATLEYVVSVVNIGAVPAYDVSITDDLDAPDAGQLTLVAGSARMNGSVDGLAEVGSLLTASYSDVHGALDPSRSIMLRFRAVLDADLPIGTRVTNTANVHWNDPVQTASASVSIDVGGTPGVGILNGNVWHDADFDRVPGESEPRLEGWTVELYRNEVLVHSTASDSDGAYRISGVVPNDNTDDRYELRFVRPGAGPSVAMLGTAHSEFTNDMHRISAIEVLPGSNLQSLNLPIDPNGVVYNSLTRAPIGGATLTLVRASNGSPLPTSCFRDPGQQDQVTLADGFYKFDLDFSDAACPSGGSYLIVVAPPSSAFVGGISEIIPPQSGAGTSPFSVPACPGTIDDAVPATAEHCEVVPTALAPPPSVGARTAGTNYHLQLLLDDSRLPGSGQIYNNHIPLDLDLDGSVGITKTTPLVNVTRGQLVPYTITVSNGIGVNLDDIAVVDRIPPGFRYVEGSARLNGVPAEPQVVGRELVWTGLSVAAEGRHTLMLLLGIGSGVGEGEFVNRAQVVHALTGNALSGEATATVRLVPDPALDCTDVIGKVFDDANRNGVQDRGERGIGGVRVVTARGLAATTDRYGRFHVTCAITPREGRGSNFVLKLDDRTLPTGYRASTDTLQIRRATRGKAIEMNFGASIHRVIGLDIADPVFEPGTIEMRRLWRPRLDLLLDELHSGPAVLRLSYLADLEEPQLVQRRLDAMKKEVRSAWQASEECCAYELEIETEVFWRRGAPPDESRRRRRAGR
jgi:uncharacterized repeat protein (TIGR01451 family)